MSLEYCPYCKKDVPVHKQPKKGVCWVFFFISIILPNLSMILLLEVPNPYFLVVTLTVGLPLVTGTIILIWILYLKKIRPTVCNLCGSHTSRITPDVTKYCSNCGKAISQTDKFCKECGANQD